MAMETKAKGHLSAMLTIAIWGSTFIATKILLKAFLPVEILFFRFLIGYIVLLIVSPKRLKTTSWKQEITYVTAGLCGIYLYYLLENIALTFTFASNVGVVVSIAPFFVAILSQIFMRSEEKLHTKFFVGFIVAMAGIICISFNGAQLKLNPSGDILAIVAAVVWGLYSILTKKISNFGYSVILSTRRTFFYGILFMIPTLFAFDAPMDISRLANMSYLLNFLYLGVGASAICFVTWNYAVKELGAVKTSVYIYMVPVITVLTSVIVLHEKLTTLSVVGTLLTLAGLFLSEGKTKNRSKTS